MGGILNLVTGFRIKIQSKLYGDIQNTLVGGVDGVTSGIVSSPVAGSKLIVSGYAGIGVFAPYKSFIIEQI